MIKMRKLLVSRWFLIAIFSSLACLTGVYLLKFRQSFTLEEAAKIRNDAIKQNDVEKFININNDYFYQASLPEARKSPVLWQLKRRNFAGALTAYKESGQIHHLTQWQFWTMLLPMVKDHPRLYEASLKELNKNVSFLTRNRISNIQTADEKLMQLYDSELLKGAAIDRLWQVFIQTGNYHALADFLIKSTESHLDTRGLEPLIRSYLSNDPENPVLLRAEGLMSWTRGEFGRAEELLGEAALYIENDPIGRFAWAESRLALGLEIDADEIMGAVKPDDLNFKTQEARRLYFLSILQEKAGKTSEAIAALEASIRINTDDAEVWLALEKLRKIQGDKTGAEQSGKSASEKMDLFTRLRKCHVTFRKSGATPELVREMTQVAKDWQLDDVALAWEIYAQPTSPAVRNQELQTKLNRKVVQPDRFFLTRPTLRQISLIRSQWKWLDTTSAEKKQVSENAIQFVEIPVETSNLDYVYESHEIPGQLKVADVMGGGVAVIDFNKDGLLDLYFPGSCKFSDVGDVQTISGSRLYQNIGNFQFKNVTEKAGVSGQGYLMGATVGDYNNDGWPDLFVTGYGNTILYKNNADGTFQDVTSKTGLASKSWTTATAFADFDGDGDQDLVAVTYVDAPINQPENCSDDLLKPIHCSPGKFNAQPDILWENLGDGTFRDISESSGIASAINGRGLGLAVADLNEDGLLDIFVANDASPNFYFQNEGGLKFREMAAEAGLAVDGAGKATASMGVVADDLDEDGLIDIFHTNFINEANTLRKNLGNGLFIDATFATGLSASSLSRTGFGTVAFDADLDGHKDLFIANGHLDNQPHINYLMTQSPLFYRGIGKKGFEVISQTAFPYLSKKVVGRGMASSDFNNDGLIDLIVVHRDSPVTLLKNNSKTSAKWLGIELQNANGSVAPIGTKVTLNFNDRSATCWVTPSNSYLSANDQRMVFAIPEPDKLKSLVIQRPSVKGQDSSVETVAFPGQLNQYHLIQLK